MNLSEFEDDYEEIAELRGAILDTPVIELMGKNPLIIDADATLVAAINAMNERRTGCVLVQKAGDLVGIFTERDVLRRVVFRDGNRSWKVESVMTKNPETLPPTPTTPPAPAKMIRRAPGSTDGTWPTWTRTAPSKIPTATGGGLMSKRSTAGSPSPPITRPTSKAWSPTSRATAVTLASTRRLVNGPRSREPSPRRARSAP